MIDGSSAAEIVNGSSVAVEWANAHHSDAPETATAVVELIRKNSRADRSYGRSQDAAPATAVSPICSRSHTTSSPIRPSGTP